MVLVAFRISKLRELKIFRVLETNRELSYIGPAILEADKFLQPVTLIPTGLLLRNTVHNIS